MFRTPLAPMKKFLLPLLPAFALSLLAEEAGPAKLRSTVFRFEELAVKPTEVGERRDVSRQPTATLAEFECHVSTLNPEKASHPPHTHAQEELIILREGTLDVHQDGHDTRVGPGSVFFFAANHPHAVQNHGDTPAKYFVFNFSTAETARLKGQPAAPTPAGHLGSSVFEWRDLAVKPTPTGERRDLFDRPTATLVNFECHVTTLQPGVAPHPPHRHHDEEIVLVKDGELEVTLNGRTERAGPGSIVFISADDEHGWRNTGATPATYYVMRLKTEQTKLPAAL